MALRQGPPVSRPCLLARAAAIPTAPRRAKGSGKWKRISWDDALTEIADRWQGIIAEHGAEAILPYTFSGTLGLLQNLVASIRLWNRMGATGLERSICGAAAEHGRQR